MINKIAAFVLNTIKSIGDVSWNGKNHEIEIDGKLDLAEMPDAIITIQVKRYRPMSEFGESGHYYDSESHKKVIKNGINGTVITKTRPYELSGAEMNFIYDAYVKRHLTQKQISAVSNIPQDYVYRYVKQHKLTPEYKPYLRQESDVDQLYNALLSMIKPERSVEGKIKLSELAAKWPSTTPINLSIKKALTDVANSYYENPQSSYNNNRQDNNSTIPVTGDMVFVIPAYNKVDLLKDLSPNKNHIDYIKQCINSAIKWTCNSQVMYGTMFGYSDVIIEYAAYIIYINMYSDENPVYSEASRVYFSVNQTYKGLTTSQIIYLLQDLTNRVKINPNADGTLLIPVIPTNNYDYDVINIITIPQA